MIGYKIMDGAMGSEFVRRGLTLPGHIWSAEANINNPKIVQKIHREYIDTGVDYITTNTFRTTPRAYLKTGLGDEGSVQMAKYSLTRAVEHAREAAVSCVKIIGSIAPLEDCYTPKLFPGKDVAILEFSQLGEWLSSAKVDILLFETMNSIAETEVGLIAVENLGLPVWVSFVLKDDHHLLSGDSLVGALEMIKHHSVECVMLNCNPLDRTVMAVEKLVDNWPGKWGVCPNIGIGEPSADGNIHLYEKMSCFISAMEKIINNGPFVLGACCGSSSKHIQVLNNLKYELFK